MQLYYEKLGRDNSLFPCFNTFYDFLQEDFVEVLKTDKVKDKAMGEKVLTAVSPGQLMVKIVKDELAELMGGEIRVESSPGKGSTFHFLLVGERSG